MGRAHGARVWARVLSELAAVPVTAEWERPAWRVSWRAGGERRFGTGWMSELIRAGPGS